MPGRFNQCQCGRLKNCDPHRPGGLHQRRGEVRLGLLESLQNCGCVLHQYLRLRSQLNPASRFAQQFDSDLFLEQAQLLGDG